jgi:hypothetical protein
MALAVTILPRGLRCAVQCRSIDLVREGQCRERDAGTLLEALAPQCCLIGVECA